MMLEEDILERLAGAILLQMVANPTTTANLDEKKIVGKAWRYAEYFISERTKRREVAEAMRELER